MSDDNPGLPFVNSPEELYQEFENLSQPRTNYALQHFVVGQHDLPGRQYQQAVLELQTLIFSIGELSDDLELARIELEKLMAKQPGAKNKWAQREHDLAISKAKRRVQALHIDFVGRLREANFLLNLIVTMPRYTLEQIEAEEAQYWGVRLARQHFEALMGDPGNLDAAIQMFTTPGAPKPQLAGLGDLIMRFGELPIRKQLEELAGLPALPAPVSEIKEE